MMHDSFRSSTKGAIFYGNACYWQTSTFLTAYLMI